MLNYIDSKCVLYKDGTTENGVLGSLGCICACMEFWGLGNGGKGVRHPHMGLYLPIGGVFASHYTV